MVANIEGKEQAQLENFYARRVRKLWITHAGLSVEEFHNCACSFS